MSKKAYPLDPLLQYRDQLVTKQSEDVAKRVGEKAKAQANVLQQEQALAVHQQHTQAVIDTELKRATEGVVRATDLVQLHGFKTGQQAIAQRLEARVEQAHKSCQIAEQRELQAKTLLGHARSNLDIVVHHKSNHVSAQRKREDEQQDEEGQDRFLSRHVRQQR